MYVGIIKVATATVFLAFAAGDTVFVGRPATAVKACALSLHRPMLPFPPIRLCCREL